MFDELQSQKEKCLAIVAPSVNLMLGSFADSPQNAKKKEMPSLIFA